MDNTFVFNKKTSLGKDGPSNIRSGKGNGLRIGILNVQTLTGKVEEISDLMERRNLDILGLGETRWKGQGRKELRKGFWLYWNGNEVGKRNGVGVVVRDGLKEEVEGINDRLMRLKVHVKGRKMEILQVYAPQVGCTAQEKEEFEEELQKQMRGQNIMIMGDFNAHVGTERQGYESVLGAEGWGNRNEEGKRLLEFCKRNGLMIGNSWYRKQESHKITWYSSDWTRRSVVDYLIFDGETKRNVTDIKVIPSEALDGDHRLVVMNYRMRIERRKPERKERKIKVWKLKEEQTKEEYQKRVKNRLPRDEAGSVEEWEKFKKVLLEAAEATCGRTSSIKRWKETPWWNERAKEAVGRKNKAFREWFQQRTTETREDYYAKKKEAKRIVAEERRKWMEKWTEMMEEDSKGNKRVLYGMVKGRRKGITENPIMQDENGKEVYDLDKLKTMWKTYFEDLLNPDWTVEEEMAEEKENEESEEDLTWAEVEAAVQSMKSGRAPGIDEVTVETIRAAAEVGKQWLYRIMRSVWKERKTPTDWKKGIIVPIFKKGNRKVCSNYRGVTLMCHCAKIFEKILERRIRTKIEKGLREEQYGFRPGRSTMDPIFSVRQLQEKHYEFGQDLILAFLDMEKAYDCVCRSKVWEALISKGVGRCTVNRVREMYRGSRSCVKVGSERTDWIEQRSGLKQGSAISPLLFIAVMDEVMIKVARRIGEENMKVMAFADDLMIWGNEEEEVQRQLDVWVEISGLYGMKFNANKSEYMVTTRKKERPFSGLQIGQEWMKRVNSYKYLGSVVEENGKCAGDISERGRQAEAFLRSVRSLVWNKDVPQKSKRIIYRSYYVPILTYASETWTMKKRDESKIQASEMKFLRSTIRVTRRDRIRNVKIREMLKEEPLQEKIQTSRLKWYGHVKRMGEDRLPRKAHETEMKGKRPRGKPRDRWLKGVEESVQKKGVDWSRVVAERWWEDRRKWRGLCAMQTRPVAGNCDG